MTATARHLLATAAITALTALPLTAQQARAAPGLPDGPGALGSLTTADFATGLARLLISYTRLGAEVQYGSLEPDAAGRGFVLRDLRARGLGGAADCTVTLERLGVSGLTLLPPARASARLDIADLSIAAACFGTGEEGTGEAGMGEVYVRLMTGGDHLTVSSLTLDATTDAASGAVTADLGATMPGLARVEAAGDFDYLALTIPGLLAALEEEAAEGGPADDMGVDDMGGDGIDGDAPDGTTADDSGPPGVAVQGTLRAAHVTVQDLGVWARLQPMMTGGAPLPPEALDDLATAEPGTPLRTFEDRLVVALKGFVAAPGYVTASLRPEAPVRFFTEGWQSADDALALAMPEFSNAAAPPVVTLRTVPPAAATAGDGGDPRALGLALARGDGVPQNPRRAVELLAGLGADGEVALALSDAVLPGDPASAYRYAQQAAEAGTPGALTALDRAEARLPSGAVFVAQPSPSTALPDTAFASVTALRDLALAYEQGDGVPRSYALAWRLGSLAGATGDTAARSLLARLEARFGGDADWIRLRDIAADTAASDWNGQDLATRLTGG